MLKTIKLKDGFDVEVDIDDRIEHEISFNKTLDISIKNITEMIGKITDPICETFKRVNNRSEIDSAKVSFGININIEGGFVLAKGSTGANIQIEMTMRLQNE